MTTSFDLQVGHSVWFEGESWVVEELLGGSVRLRGAISTRLLGIGTLIGHAYPMDESLPPPRQHGDVPFEMPKLGSVVLASLTTEQRDDVLATEEIIRTLGKSDSVQTATARFAAAAKKLNKHPRSVRRLASDYEKYGFVALVDKRLLRSVLTTVDPAWDEICLTILEEYTDASTPTRDVVLEKTNEAFRAKFPRRKLPSRAVAYDRIAQLSAGRYTFGPSQQRRSVSERPTGVLGRLRATRPGEFIIMDTYKLDVYAMEPITLRWVSVELTVAIDLYSRCIVGLCLRAAGARSADVASVLYQSITSQTWGTYLEAPEGPYLGVPESIVLSDIGVVPDSIIVDHGKIYLSSHVLGVCERNGINVQPARVYRPTDKGVMEHWFKTLREQFLQHLQGYMGKDFANRGVGAEKQAFYYVDELQQMIREWVGIYHSTPHSGLRDPRLPWVDLSPAEMFTRGVQQSGRLRLPIDEELPYEFLDVAWRTIQHYGVEMHGRRYNGVSLNQYRGRKSPYGGAHAGKWPFMVDIDDIRYVHFRDPSDGTWHHLMWEHAAELHAPFSADAAAFTREISLRKNRHVHPKQALGELMKEFAQGQVIDRRQKNLAIRISAQRALAFPSFHPEDSPEPKRKDKSSARDLASLPAVVDLLLNVSTSDDGVRDDLDHADLDTFDKYYTAHPEGGLTRLDDWDE